MNENNNNMPSVKAKITWMNEDQSAPKKASASVTLADSFQVHGISIVEGSKGLFISMPQRQTSDKKFVEIAHPVTAEMRKAIYDAVMGAYSQSLALSNQYKANFHVDSKPAEKVPSQGNATSDDLPSEVNTDQENTEESSEDEAPAPIMGQMM